MTGADSTVTPFAARRYIAGHADTGKYLKVTETATEVVETDPATFAFTVIRVSRSYTARRAVRRYPYAQRPVSGFLNGLPERQTGSTQEYFQVSPPHYNAAHGPASQSYRVDGGPWQPMPGSRVFETSKLGLGRHRVEVLTADAAGDTVLSFHWRVVPLPGPGPLHQAARRVLLVPAAPGPHRPPHALGLADRPGDPAAADRPARG